MKLSREQLKKVIFEAMYDDQGHLDEAETDYDYKSLGDALIDYVIERINEAPAHRIYGRYSHIEKHFYDWQFDRVKVEHINYTGDTLRLRLQTPDGPKTIILQASVS